MEKFEPRYLGIVVVAEYNNPSILNPDFLARHNIVSSDTPEIDDRNTFCTPGLSQVTYKGGLTVISRPDRLEFNEEFGGTEKVRASAVAVKYLEKVPLVKYTAVGINPVGDIRLPMGASRVLADRLIQEGSWNEHEGQKPNIELIFSYRSAVKNFTVRVSPAKDNKGVEILIFRGNIHRGIKQSPEEDTSKKAVEIIRKWEGDVEEYKKYVEEFYKNLNC